VGQRFRPEIRQGLTNRSSGNGAAGSASANTVGAMLRTSRQALGLSQHRVSDLTAEHGIPVSRSAICDIERGCNMPGVESLVSLCDVLQLDPRELLERVVFPTELVGDVANCSIGEMKRRVSLLYWSCQYRATATVCAALLDRVELERPGEPAERRRLCARIEISRAGALRRCGRLQAAEAAARRSLRFAAGNEDLQAESLIALARLHLDDALVALAQAESDQAVRMAQAGGSPRVLAFAWAVMAGSLHYALRLEEAADAHRRARGFSIQAGDQRIQAGIEGSFGSCLEDLGHPSAALRQYTTAVDLARKGGDPNGEVCWQLETGRMALRLEAPDEAERRAAAALRIARMGDNPLSMFRGIWLQHQIARRRNSRKPDRQAVTYLKRLYPRVAGFKGIDAVREFKREILGFECA
jgi:transcriptional regulator with XRE-family HTH domain